MASPYKLYYWPIPGRGEFVRLLLEHCGVPYEDVARTGPEGMAAVAAAKENCPGTLHYAPPILQISDTFSLSQTTVICAYLAKKHGLMPDGEEKEYIAMQIDHTVHDIVVEVHATHHPVDIADTYEGQMPEAKRAAKSVTSQRLPKLLGHLEKCVAFHGQGKGPFLFGDKICYVDLSLAYVLDGVKFAFPKTFKDSLSEMIPRLLALREAVGKVETVASYRKSDRMLPFSNGIFRHYPELDQKPKMM